MTDLARVPCTVVTGFLGAGKTTLSVPAGERRGRRPAVLVNEFGDVGIDGEVLKGCGIASCEEEDIVELANGCICCTVADDFVPALDKILARAGDRPHPDRDERAGAAEAAGAGVPVAGASRVTVDSVVVVVDGALAEGRGGGALSAQRRTRRSSTTIRSRRCSATRWPAPI